MMKKLFSVIALMGAGCVLGFLSLLILQELKRPDLDLWHTVSLDAEFTSEHREETRNMAGYRKLEDNLFKQLSSRIVEQTPLSPKQEFNRYYPGSWSNPSRHSHNWNRTFELSTESPRAGFLLLHGLSDSPYSLRTIGEALNAQGGWVLGLRLPGHGTAPSGMATVTWQDGAAAVRIAMDHLHNVLGGDVPIFIVGYSNGAALALEYTLSCLEGESLHQPAGLVLISPAVSVSPLAVFAQWKLMLSKLPGLRQLAWLSVELEYDPYKYNSFAVNGAVQIHHLTKKVARQIQKLDKGNGLQNFPSTLAFVSAADATVPPAALVDNFMRFLPPNNHRLVLFDVNREADSKVIMKRDPADQFSHLSGQALPFDFHVVTNISPESREVIVRRRSALSIKEETTPIPYVWPRDIYSLSHVSLPFGPDDRIYGIAGSQPDTAFTLGSLEPRGERGLLSLPLENLMRLRYNPFYEYLEQTTINWTLR